MLRVTTISAALFLVAAAPAAAPAPVAVQPGEAVTLLVDGRGKVAVHDRRIGQDLSRFERAAVGMLSGGAFDYAMGPNSAAINPEEQGLPEPEPVEEGRVQLKFVSLPGKGSVLIIKNGYSRAFNYEAEMRVNGRSVRTDVCQVLPDKYGFEHWPHRIDSISLSRIRMSKWKEGRAPVCK